MSKAKILFAIAFTIGTASGCSGKKRDFGEAVVLPNQTEGAGGNSAATAATPPPPTTPSGPAAVGAACNSGAECASGTCADGACGEVMIDDSGELSMAAGDVDDCGDACSGQCQPGEARCVSLTERSECGVDALWSAAAPCPFACVAGTCTGECIPGATECLTTTRFRSCSDQGAWSEPADCPSACVETACAGECVPGQTQCASTTTVQTCSDLGAWGEPAACQNACVGTACTGECMPGATRCATETSLQTCNDQGQFLAGAPCPFACVDGACGGECIPGSGRCDPTTGVPQLCSDTGAWQAQPPCPFVCSGSGSCTGECTPGSRRCNPASGVPQTCSAAGSFENQAACPFACTNGACTGECTPGSQRCDPTSGVPQICGNDSTWQSQAPCARGCQNGACIPQLGPGTACVSGRDCTTGFCTDGVCCESDCSGVCAQCEAGTGACITPATDPDCDPVVCAANECRLSSGDLTTNLCRARGQCKDESDCSFTAFARGTPCDAVNSRFTFCDGAGQCIGPTVTCAGVSGRPVSDDIVCCSRRDGVAQPFTSSETYGPNADCPASAPIRAGGTPIRCDETADCRLGEVCCYTTASGGSVISCVSAASCNNDSGPQATLREVCGAPGGFSDDCLPGFSCAPASEGELFPGWSYCR